MKDNLRRAVVICIIALIALGTLLGIYVADFRARRGAVQRAESVLVDSAMEQASTLSHTLGGEFQLLRGAAASLALSGAEEPADIEAVLKDISDAAELNFAAVDLLLPDGVKATADPEYDSSMAHRDYFKTAMSGEAAMEQVVGGSSGQQLLTLAVPYIKNGEICGVLRGSYRADNFEQLLNSQAYGGDGYSLLVCGHGDIIVNTESDTLFTGEQSLFTLLEDAEFSDGDSFERLCEDFSAGRSAAVHYSLGGEPLVAVLVPLHSESLPINDWFIFNVVSEESLLSEIGESRRNSIESMLIFAAFVAAALGLFILLEVDRRRKKAYGERAHPSARGAVPRCHGAERQICHTLRYTHSYHNQRRPRHGRPRRGLPRKRRRGGDNRARLCGPVQRGGLPRILSPHRFG